MRTLLVLFVSYFALCFGERADMMVFSYNRPLQLYAYLESFYENVTGYGTLIVVYRSDNAEYDAGYQVVQEKFPHVCFIQQSRTTPLKEFRPLVMRFLKDRSFAISDYCVFAVDDIVVKEPINLEEDIESLKTINAYGFYYRLGKGVDYCYMEDAYQGVPGLRKVGDDTYVFCFDEGKCDWAYPNTVDLTLYKKEEINEMIQTIRFTFPNNFEGNWAAIRPKNRLGLCHGSTKMVNIPVNIVSTFRNRSNRSYSAEELLRIFLNEGLKMDIRPLQYMKNNSAHIDYTITFTPR